MSSFGRVLLVSHEATLSGAPIQLVYLARWLLEHGWSVRVVAPEDGPVGDALRSSDVTFETEPDLLTDLSHETLRRYARESDVVVANTITTWQAVQAAREENVPVLWYLHETLVGRRLVRDIPQIRTALVLADRLVVPTRATACVYDTLSRTPIDVVPYGIPAPQVRGSASRNAELNFVTLGSYEHRKGQDVLLDAIESLPREISSAARFRLAGRNLDDTFHRSLAPRAAELPSVDLLGAASHDESLQMLADADVLVLPSRDETMPIVLLEAMALGKAIIATDVGGIREWIRDGRNGIVVPAEDPAALAEALQRSVEGSELIRRLAASARRTWQRHFTIERYGAAFEDLLRETLRRQPRAAHFASNGEWPELYADWVATYDKDTPSKRLTTRRKSRRLRRQPLISIVMPVYNPDIEVLRSAITSVQRQIYQHWELCIADDASSAAEVRPFLEEQAATDARIKVVFRSTNGHIAACSNSALALATGEWIALLDQDDALAADALAAVVEEINEHPDAGIIYSDEDKISADDVRSFPFFKPDWNPELFLAQNYINHLGVYRAALLRGIGGFREGFEGSQDYDLALRCIERLQSAQIRHIPRVLYHWRAVPGSLAEKADAKPYAKLAARRAIQEHLERRGVAARVEACPENPESHRVVYSVPEPAPLVSIIVPTRNQAAMLRHCITSLRATDYSIEFIVVDHASDEADAIKFLEQLSHDPDVRVTRETGAFNFSRLNNSGARHARGSLLAFINNDIEANQAGWLAEMVSQITQPAVGAVGARLWYPDGTLQHGGVVLGLGGVAGHAHHRVPRGHPGYFNRVLLQQNCSAVTAACMLVRASVFHELGGFDEAALAVNFNDVDLCLRMRALGWQIVWTPYADLVHRESVSRGTHARAAQQELFVREASYMQRRWGAELLHDPFYSANLRLELPAFYPAFPPRRTAA